LGNNKEIYSVLNLKISFSKSIFSCRCCDVNTKDTPNNIIKNYDKFIIKNNEDYNEEVQNRRISKFYEKFYNPTEISNIFILKKINYMYTFPLDLQHIEFEGEVQREIILLFLNIPNYLQTFEFYNMMKFLKNTTKINNIEYFFQNLILLKNKVFPNIENATYKDFTLTSGESMIIFNILPFFFRTFFLHYLTKYFIRSYLLHKKYIEILMEKYNDKQSLKLVYDYIKDLNIIYLRNNIKVKYLFLN